ncbi:hypothetical protein POJ06DRAFT_279400 [Lipomyces tetrasporus]|uniref:Uncharacterized protein n=1 Tax=Lipomyces tetrasporus TaxID=54092 RepID=A0AAD7QY99_9ASCO|nr:uncharacterized protein POJ06DRAFT_279400 [Lipomyces tetrasporus]KAJ8103669.1 hypothetical protein POJ06DRAFT_279400 [Lipomyces tetrasporus]
MAHSNLLEVVRGRLSRDTRLEVSASREEYEQVGEVLEREEASYPQLWYDSAKGVAIVVVPRTPLHSGMVGALVSSISDEVKMNSGISPAIRRNLRSDSDSTRHSNTSRGLTTRAWDGALLYREGDRLILMIAVEVGVSQSYDSLRAAISWFVCALRCRLGVSMSISESSRRTKPNHPYGPLQRDVRPVILEAYRGQDENCGPETILEPSQSFTIVEKGEYIGDNISPNLRELVLEDCIPSRLLQGHEIRATFFFFLDFFHHEWFENEFRASMVLTAIGRLGSYLEHTPI